MSWVPAAADIYERMRGALFCHKAEYFHPEYPDEWLDDRLRQFLPRLPFYCTETCVLRPVVKRDFIYFEQILSFGAPSPRQALSLVALSYDLSEHLAVPILAESFNPVRHRHLGNVSEQELQFPLFNAAADDPWDTELDGPSDPHSALQRTVGEFSEDVELYLSPLYGYLYFDEERSDAIDIIETVSRVARALHVSSASRSLTRKLHQRFATERTGSRFVGEPRINYITTIPNRSLLERCRRRDQARPVEKWILLEGRLHAL